jgi:hypothetical protein
VIRVVIWVIDIFGPPIVRELGDKSIDKSRWAMMTDVLPGSRDEKYDKQQKIVADLAEKFLIGYEVPETIWATACIFSKHFQYFDSKKCSFCNEPWTYTNCKETILHPPIQNQQVKEHLIVVGGLLPTGLEVNSYTYGEVDFIGMAALKKF